MATWRERLADFELYYPMKDRRRAATDSDFARLEAALGQLPAGAREIVLLAVVERLEPAQVAAVLGLRPEAARQRLARARAMLAKLFAEAPGSRDPVGEAP